MKRYGNIWGKVITEENIKSAFRNACRTSNRQSHATRTAIRRMKSHLEDCVRYILYILKKGTWLPSGYKERVIYEPKKRTIYIAKFFPDRVIHHALVDVLEPIWDKIMIYDTYSCRKGKGQHAGSRRCMEYIRKNRYCLKCDISKFYPSLDHDVLKTILRRKIKDKYVLKNLELIVDSYPGRKNAPIGNLTSQWFGNLYLSELDDFAKQTLRVKSYIRYCDDFVLFANNKETLKTWGMKLRKFVTERLLLTFSKFDLFPVSRGIDFLGYRHFPNGYILVRKSTAKRMKARLKEIPHLLRIGKMDKDKAISIIASAEGWIKHANSFHLKDAMQIEKLRKEVQHERLCGICQ